MPCRVELGEGSQSGPLCFCRRFSWPGRLDSHERIWLVISGISRSSQLFLNGALLVPDPDIETALECDITAHVRARNELQIEPPASASGPIFESAALEVRCKAFLRDCQWQLRRVGDRLRLHVTGRLMGTADVTLEIYALLDGRTVIYRTLKPDAAGSRFEFESDDVEIEVDPSRLCRVQVDLVNAATQWHSIQGELLMPSAG
jgi:hypothetical protein